MKRILLALSLSAILLWLTLPAACQNSSGSLDQQLITAAKLGYTTQVQQLLDKGANANATDGGWTALMGAADAGKADMATLLLDKGANIEAKDNDGATALTIAAYEGNADVVRLLLDKGANIEAKKNNGDTALMNAAHEGKADVVELLLSKGANLEAKDNNGWTALMNAAYRSHTDVVKLLLSKGANIEAKNNDGKTALDEALDFCNVTTARVLLEQNAGGSAPGGANLLPQVLEKCSSVKESDRDSAFLRAVEDDDVDLAQALLDKGANIEAKGFYDQTALMKAASGGKTDFVKLLLDKGADIEAKDKAGRTALLLAGNADMVKLLLDKGANIEAKDNQGWTPLRIAVAKYDPDAVKLLLDKGASSDEERHYVADQLTSFCPANGNPVELQKLLNVFKMMHGNINVRNTLGETALLNAVGERCGKDVAQTLIENGADVNTFDRNGQTPLMEATYLNETDLVKLLLANSANPNAQNNDRNTALLMACGSNGVVRPDIVRVLIDKGADPNLRGSFTNETPLEVVRRSLSNGRMVRNHPELAQDYGPPISAADEHVYMQIENMLVQAGGK